MVSSGSLFLPLSSRDAVRARPSRPSCALAATNIVISDDDGWATAQIRQQFDVLLNAGHNVRVLYMWCCRSAPALNQSGRGSLSKTPTPLTEPCEFNTCPTGSSATASVDAARYGIQTLAPQFFDGAKPDFVVSGPNVGNNLGLVVLLSGTVGAACEAARSGIPAAAFSGASGSEFLTALTSTPGPFLPADTIVNVNYAAITDNCTSSESFKWVFSRLVWNLFETDYETCGSDHLPRETEVVNHVAGCYASVSVISASNKLDVNSTLQGQVYNRLRSSLPLVCME
ncbi:survival protein sure-like phosphatase/nucleotidase [Cerioporus squamosus]|nr:survival protein sure-like phosphatase/nucleotidase [Cerioporus squamosus]